MQQGLSFLFFVFEDVLLSPHHVWKDHVSSTALVRHLCHKSGLHICPLHFRGKFPCSLCLPLYQNICFRICFFFFFMAVKSSHSLVLQECFVYFWIFAFPCKFWKHLVKLHLKCYFSGDFITYIDNLWWSDVFVVVSLIIHEHAI